MPSNLYSWTSNPKGFFYIRDKVELRNVLIFKNHYLLKNSNIVFIKFHHYNFHHVTIFCNSSFFTYIVAYSIRSQLKFSFLYEAFHEFCPQAQNCDLWCCDDMECQSLRVCEREKGQKLGGYEYILGCQMLIGDILTASGVFYSEILYLRLCNGIDIVTWAN